MVPCNVCNDLNKIDGPTSYKPIDPKELETSAQSERCQICPLLLAANQAIEAKLNRKVTNIELINRLGADARDGTLCMEVRDESGKRQVFELYSTEDYSALSLPKPFNKIKQAHDAPGDTSSPMSLSWVKQRLHECTTSHTSCPYLPTPSLPKRVLDLGPLGSRANIECVKLLETTNQTGRYACLSHCWGTTTTPLKTTTLNLSHHLSSIPLTSLPKTYLDAITFTHSLGIRYLWIDSLCIIQDSPLDWRTESSHMSIIYKNSTLVLAATMSRDAFGGCFSSIPSYTWQHPLDITIDPNSVQYKLRTMISHSPYMTYHSRGAQQGPLFHRAWVFQERILAPRVLFFLPGELIFKCCLHTVCECAAAFLSHNENWLYSEKGGREESWSACWREWVHGYSSLDLTYPSDKLPAISGLAREMSSCLSPSNNSSNPRPGNYLAGLWHGSLPGDLLWYVQDYFQSPAPLPKRHPSWSWCSVDSKVSFRPASNLNTSSYNIISASTTLPPSSSDVFGQVASGSLILSGHLTRVILRHSTEIEPSDSGLLDWRIYHNFAVGVSETASFTGVYMDTTWNTDIAWRSVEGEEGLLQYEEGLWCFGVGESDISRFFLVLTRVEAGVYERVGLAWLRVGQGWKGDLREGNSEDEGEKVVIKII